jgi:hypothetical protein
MEKDRTTARDSPDRSVPPHRKIVMDRLRQPSPFSPSLPHIPNLHPGRSPRKRPRPWNAALGERRVGWLRSRGFRVPPPSRWLRSRGFAGSRRLVGFVRAVPQRVVPRYRLPSWQAWLRSRDFASGDRPRLERRSARDGQCVSAGLSRFRTMHAQTISSSIAEIQGRPYCQRFLSSDSPIMDYNAWFFKTQNPPYRKSLEDATQSKAGCHALFPTPADPCPGPQTEIAAFGGAPGSAPVRARSAANQ